MAAAVFFNLLHAHTLCCACSASRAQLYGSRSIMLRCEIQRASRVLSLVVIPRHRSPLVARDLLCHVASSPLRAGQ